MSDLFRAGHVALLREARRHGDRLLVGVRSDAAAPTLGMGIASSCMTAPPRLKIAYDKDTKDAESRSQPRFSFPANPGANGSVKYNANAQSLHMSDCRFLGTSGIGLYIVTAAAGRVTLSGNDLGSHLHPAGYLACGLQGRWKLSLRRVPVVGMVGDSDGTG